MRLNSFGGDTFRLHRHSVAGELKQKRTRRKVNSITAQRHRNFDIEEKCGDLHGHTQTGNDTGNDIEQNMNRYLPLFLSVPVGESSCRSLNSACLAANAALALLNILQCSEHNLKETVFLINPDMIYDVFIFRSAQKMQFGIAI